MSGRLIVLEGIDGSGKSTQFKLLCGKLKSEGVQYKRLTFPRYDEPSSMLIRMYLAGDFGTDPGDVNPYAASSFFAVDRYASFVQDWREHYGGGGLILTDRYTTSNAIHQGAKMSSLEREKYFKWLYDYEFNLIGLPAPDLTLYMNIDAALAAERLKERQEQTATSADIHEKDGAYLSSCAQSGLEAAKFLNWHIIDCAKDGIGRSAEDIQSEVYTKVKCLMNAEK